MMKKTILFLLSLMLVAAGCQSKPVTESPEPQSLNVMTHDSFSVSSELIQAFEAANQVKINFIKAGDTGAALNRLLLTSLSGGIPEADVFYGLDNTFLSRALAENLFEPYQAPALASIPQQFQLDPAFGALPVDFGDVCINYDKAYFAEKGIPVPNSLEELTDPVYAEMLVVENPSTSSPSQAFMFATIAHFGEEAWLDWWQALKENGVVVSSDWETAYYTHFSGSSGRGPQPMVVSYASSPAAELIYAETELEESPTASILADGACWRQIEFAGIVRGTENRDLAEKFMDFLLSQEFQEDVPLQMFVYPVLPEAKLPEAFIEASQNPEEPATLDPQLIALNRDAWVNAWIELMLTQ